MTMPNKLNLLACQMVSSPDIENNFAQLEQQLQSLLTDGQEAQTIDRSLPTLVVLPESFALFGADAGLALAHQETLGQGPIQSRLAALAKRYQIWLAAGTLATTSHRTDKFFATLTVFNPAGQLVADYQKIHLFDVDVADSTGAYRESDNTVPGNRVVLFDIQGITVGLAVCYDVRFPGLFGQLAANGAQVIVLPSAFTRRTGQAHWDVLIKARAIENQVYMVAPAQGGIHANGRETHGRSLIVDPWGETLTQAGMGASMIHAVYDPDLIKQVRHNMPVQQHNRFKSKYG